MKPISLSSPQLRILYIVSFFIYGIIISAIGPLIPYLSASTSIPQTEYSSFFSLRALGMIIGGVFYQYFLHKYQAIDLHRVISISYLAIGILGVFFANVFQINMQNILMLLSSLAYCAVEVNLIFCLIKTVQKQLISFWIIIQTTGFGIGALIGPFLVYLFQFNVFNILGVICIGLGILFYFLQTVNTQTHQQQAENDGKYIPNNLVYALAFMMFYMIGIQCNFSGWSSSYAVLTNIATVSQATKYPSIYWTSITVVRSFYNHIPGKNSQKLKLFMIILLSTQIISMLINISGYNSFALFFNCLTGGVSMSPIYSLILGISSQFDLLMSQKQTNIVLTFGFAGQGVIAWFCGVLMNSLTIQMFYYFNFFSQIVIAAIVAYVLISLKEIYRKNQQIKDLKIQLIQMKQS